MARIAGVNIPQNKLVHIGHLHLQNKDDFLTEFPSKRVNEFTDPMK